jgi:general stress protein YciG
MVVITVIQAGQLGGQSTFRKYGRQFFAEIGEGGQKAMRQKYPNKAREWGKLGGRPKKLSLGLIMGEKGK